jgi:hypothetical protein
MQDGVTMQFNRNVYCCPFYKTNIKRKNKEVPSDWKDMKPIEWVSYLFFQEMKRWKFIEFTSELGTESISSFLFPEGINAAVERAI